MMTLQIQDVLIILIYLMFSTSAVVAGIGGFYSEHEKECNIKWYWSFLHASFVFFIGLILIYASQQIWGIFHIFPWMYKIAVGCIFSYANFELICLFKKQFQYERGHSNFGIGGKEDLKALLGLTIGITMIIFLPIWGSLWGMSLLFGIWFWFKSFFPSKIPLKKRLSFLFPKPQAGFETVDSEGNVQEATYRITGKKNQAYLTLLGFNGKRISKNTLEIYRDEIINRHSGYGTIDRDKREMAEIAYRHLMRVIHDEPA